MSKQEKPKKPADTMANVLQDYGISSPYSDPRYEGLSYRASSVLNNCNLDTREQILEAVKNGRLLKTRNVGPAVMREILEWLGVPKRGVDHTKICPTCGGKGTVQE